jgi:FMN phosphatase YigB (HAD superfamily)
MSISKKRKLFKKIIGYQLIIFDLDNTILNSSTYEKKIFIKIAKFLNLKINFEKKKVFNFLLKNRKKEILTNKKINIFDILLKKYENRNYYKKRCLKIFNSSKVNKINFNKTLYNVLQNLKKKNKELYLVTNGNYNRQINKIRILKISKLFKHIFILEKKSHQKPSLIGVQILKKAIINKKSVMIGDSNLDKEFANKLSIDYIKFINDF